MIIESLVAATTVIIVASLKYTDKIVNGDKREARKFEAEQAQLDRLADINIKEKENAEIEKERQATAQEVDRVKEEEYRFDPAMCKAKRLAIVEKRKLIMFERDRFVKSYDTNNKALFDEHKSSWWKAIKECNEKLVALAEEESRIPVLDETVEFGAQLKDLEAREEALRAIVLAQAAKKVEPDEEEVKYKYSAKKEALERERTVMEKIAVSADYGSERDEARDRLKEITNELGKL
jgi:hypothetical protein